jgi:hypothetical protein
VAVDQICDRCNSPHGTDGLGGGYCLCDLARVQMARRLKLLEDADRALKQDDQPLSAELLERAFAIKQEYGWIDSGRTPSGQPYDPHARCRLANAELKKQVGVVAEGAIDVFIEALQKTGLEDLTRGDLLECKRVAMGECVDATDYADAHADQLLEELGRLRKENASLRSPAWQAAMKAPVLTSEQEAHERRAEEATLPKYPPGSLGGTIKWSTAMPLPHRCPGCGGTCVPTCRECGEGWENEAATRAIAADERPHRACLLAIADAAIASGPHNAAMQAFASELRKRINKP